MAEQAAEYHHGEQDIHEQQATYRNAMNATKWAIVVLAAVITLLTMWFCTAAGFFNGLVVAKGRTLGIPTPLNESALELVKEIERGELKPAVANIERLPRSPG